MRSPVAATYLLVLASTVLDLTSAFTVTPLTNSRLQAVRRTTQHVPTYAFPRIPFLQRNTEEVAVVEPPTTTTTIDTLEVEGSNHSVSTEVVPINAVGAQQEPSKELSETEKLLKQVKEAGLAGVVSYALWELGFWAVSVPVVLFGYYEVTGHWPDLSDKTDIAKLSAEAFAFVNFARFAVPLRIGLALSTTPWIQSNIVDRFMKKENTDGAEVKE